MSYIYLICVTVDLYTTLRKKERKKERKKHLYGTLHKSQTLFTHNDRRNKHQVLNNCLRKTIDKGSTFSAHLIESVMLKVKKKLIIGIVVSFFLFFYQKLERKLIQLQEINQVSDKKYEKKKQKFRLRQITTI